MFDICSSLFTNIWILSSRKTNDLKIKFLSLPLTSRYALVRLFIQISENCQWKNYIFSFRTNIYVYLLFLILEQRFWILLPKLSVFRRLIVIRAFLNEYLHFIFHCNFVIFNFISIKRAFLFIVTKDNLYTQMKDYGHQSKKFLTNGQDFFNSFFGILSPPTLFFMFTLQHRTPADFKRVLANIDIVLLFCPFNIL